MNHSPCLLARSEVTVRLVSRSLLKACTYFFYPSLMFLGQIRGPTLLVASAKQRQNQIHQVNSQCKTTNMWESPPIRSKSISTHEPDEAPDALIFHPDGEKWPSRAPGSSISPGSGPSSIRRAQAIPGLPGRARGLRTKQTGVKPPRRFARVPAGRVAPTCRREWAVVVVIVSSSARCKGCRRWPASHAARRVNTSAAI
jgi:hypothetical protein